MIRPTLIFPDLQGRDRETVLRSCAERMAEQGAVPDGEELYRKLREREDLGSTALGREVAVPHCKLDNLDRVVMAVGLCRDGVEFGAQDGEPVKLIFVVVSPVDAPADHLQSLAAVSRWVGTDNHVGQILAQDDPEAIHKLLRRGSR